MRPQAGTGGITELMIAALEGNIEKARQLIFMGADVNETNHLRETPIMWAAQSGDVNIVNFLISRGADVRAKSGRGSTALLYAISRRQEAMSTALINVGADANGHNVDGQSFLEASAEDGMTGTLEALIRNGADVVSYGPSALHYAVSRRHVDIVGLLLSAGVDVNAQLTRPHKSILYTASESGNLGLVTLLLSRGAEINQSTDRESPMYPAASGGHTTIVELLLANGVPASPQYLLLAAERGYAETANVISRHVNLETLQKSEIKRLLAIAERLDQPEFTQSILRSPSVKKVRDDAVRAAEEERLASLREHSRLLFARQAEEYCVIGVWDSRSGQSTELTRISSCPYTIFASKDAESVFVVGREVVQTVTIARPAAKMNVALPDLDYRVWIEQMSVRPDRNPEYLPHGTQMRPTGVGRFEDGSLGLIVSLGMPADDEYFYLFRHINGQWILEDERWCDRWGCKNPLDSLAFITSDAWAWPESRRVWHPNVSLNPFFSDKSAEMIDLKYESYQAATHHREFEIDGVSSILTANTSPSEHSGINLTFGVELTIEGKATRDLSTNQCLTSVVGRFILVSEFFGGRFEVTDIGTGETMIDNLAAAMWLE